MITNKAETKMVVVAYAVAAFTIFYSLHYIREQEQRIIILERTMYHYLPPVIYNPCTYCHRTPTLADRLRVTRRDG